MWHVIVNRTEAPAFEYRCLNIKTVEQLLEIIKDLWSKGSEFLDDIIPPDLGDQIQEYWESLGL